MSPTPWTRSLKADPSRRVAPDLQLLAALSDVEMKAVAFVRSLALSELGEELVENAGLEELSAVFDRVELDRLRRDDTIGALVGLQGPIELSDELEALQSRVSAAEPLTEGLTALAAVVSGRSSDTFADLSVFQRDHPEWSALGLAAATGVLNSGPETDVPSTEAETEADVAPGSPVEQVEVDIDVATETGTDIETEAATDTEPAAEKERPTMKKTLRSSAGPSLNVQGGEAFMSEVGSLGAMDPRVARSLGLNPEAPPTMSPNWSGSFRGQAPDSDEGALDLADAGRPQPHGEAEIVGTPHVAESEAAVTNNPDEASDLDQLEETGHAAHDQNSLLPDPEPCEAANERSPAVPTDEEAESAPTDSAGDSAAPSASEAGDNRQSERVDVIERLVAGRRFGTAYWYASQDSDTPISKALEFASYAWAIRRPQDGPSNEAALVAATIDPADVASHPQALAITIPSLARAAIVTGQPSFNALTSRFAGYLEDRSGAEGLRALASMPFGGMAAIESNGEASAEDSEVVRGSLQQWATEYLDRAPTRRIKYDLATKVFREFVKSGPIATCLETMAADNARQLDSVRSALTEFSSEREADDIVQRFAREIRTVRRSPEIEAGALMKLRSEIADIKEHTARWIAACETPTRSPQHQAIDRAGVDDALDNIARLLKESLHSHDLQQSMATTLMQEVLKQPDPTEQEGDVPLGRHELLTWELSAEPGIATDEETGEASFSEIADEIIESVLQGVTGDKLEVLARRDDFERVLLVLRVAAAIGEPVDDSVRGAIGEIIADRSADLEHDVDEVEMLLGQARVARTIDDAQASQVLAALELREHIPTRGPWSTPSDAASLARRAADSASCSGR